MELAPIFKSMVWDIWVKKLIVKAIGLFALSPTGIVATALTKVALYYTDKLFPVFTGLVDVGTIKLKNYVHQEMYESEQLKLKITHMKYGLDSKEFRDEREKAHNKLADVIVYGKLKPSVQ